MATPLEISSNCPFRFDPGSSQVGFVVNKVALGQVFSEYFGFPSQSSFTNCSTITLTYHLGLVK
jgi:hypothetical protein